MNKYNNKKKDVEFRWSLDPVESPAENTKQAF